MTRIDPATYERPPFDPRVVSLPPELLEWADAVGTSRLLIAQQKGQRDHFDADSLESHKMGARGEAAFCYAYGIHWDATEGTYSEVPDQQPDWEIRTTSTLRYLKVRPKPHDKGRRVTFVLQQAENSFLVTCRYIAAKDAQKNYPVRDPGHREAPAHWVPKGDLLQITDIEHAIHAWLKQDAGWTCIFGGEIS